MRGIDSVEDLDDLALDIDGELVDAGAGRPRLRERGKGGAGAETPHGDFDADLEMAELMEEEIAGMHDQNVVEELGEALGLTYDDDEELWCGVKESERDRHRWELDPASAEDWGERKRR